MEVKLIAMQGQEYHVVESSLVLESGDLDFGLGFASVCLSMVQPWFRLAGL